MLAYNICHFF